MTVPFFPGRYAAMRGYLPDHCPFPAPFPCSGSGPPRPPRYGEMTMDLYIASTSDEYGVGLENEKMYTLPPAFVNI